MVEAAGNDPSSHARVPEVVLFHPVLGLRPGVLAMAACLRAHGYVVHTPDLYDGRVFDEYEPAMRYAEEIGGFAAQMSRTRAAAAALPTDVVYAGFSSGDASAELLAVSRPGARGAILFHSGIPVKYLGVERWPSTVPVQVHYSVGDPWREAEAVNGFEADVLASGARYEFFEYPGTGHLFSDAGLPNEYDAESAALMEARTVEFLRSL